MKSILGVILIGLAILGNSEVWGADSASSSHMNLEPFIYTGLGFVLGLFGNIILERIKRRRLKEDFVKGLYAQFKEIVPRLAGNFYLLKYNLGEINRDAVNWIISVRSQGYGIFSEQTIQSIESILLMNDQELGAYNQRIKQNPTIASYIKKFSLPLLEENISSISLLDLDFQHSLLDIKTKISLLNAEIERYNFFFEKTFDSTMDPNNRRIIDGNIVGSYKAISKLCRDSSDSILGFVEKLSGLLRNEVNQMNIKKGFLRLTLVVSIILGILTPLCQNWIFDKREVTVRVPEDWEKKSIQERLNSIDELFLLNNHIVWDDGTETISVLSLPKMEQWNIKRQFKEKIISEAKDPKIKKGEKPMKIFAYSFSFKVGWRELGLLGFVGFASVWIIYAFIRWVIFYFIIGGFKTKLLERR